MVLSNKPLVSVILPVYNGENHIAECIESILGQSYDNFEFVIVDDASTDSTPTILQKYADGESRIKLVPHQVNQKQTAAANTAIKNSSGKYLARMDADDVALPDRFAKQVTNLEQNSKVALIGSWFDIIDDNGNIAGSIETPVSNNYLKWNLLFDTSFAHSATMMRKYVVEKVGFYQSPEAEDYDLWSRISREAEVANLPEVLQKKRVWDGQLALKVPNETKDCVLQIMQNNMQLFLNDPKINLEVVRLIRFAIEKKKPNLDKIILQQTIDLINELYKKYIEETELSLFEKKKIMVDAFQKLLTLIHWQSEIDNSNAKINKLYLAARFPKLYLYAKGLRRR